MTRFSIRAGLVAVVAAAAASTLVFAGAAAATPADVAAPASVGLSQAGQKLRALAAGNPAAEAAVDRLLASRPAVAAHSVALHAQPFQIPAQSDIGRDGHGGNPYGSGVALGVDGFRFGFFGGPGTISPNQTGAKLQVQWFNLGTGQGGVEVLNEHNDVPMDTTIRTRVLNTGGGMVVAAVYGTVWHRWAVPVSKQFPDGFQYQLATISIPSFGAVVV